MPFAAWEVLGFTTFPSADIAAVRPPGFVEAARRVRPVPVERVRPVLVRLAGLALRTPVPAAFGVRLEDAARALRVVVPAREEEVAALRFVRVAGREGLAWVTPLEVAVAVVERVRALVRFAEVTPAFGVPLDRVRVV